MGRLPGYEYSYSFEIEDSIIPLYPIEEYLVRDEVLKTYLFEIRTSFKLKRIDDDENNIMMLGSERFGKAVLEDDGDGWFCLEKHTGFRLQVDYWMSDDEIRSWALDALDFAKQRADKDKDMIGVVVKLDVWTVQQEGESINAAIDRAIKPESLIPIHVWPHVPLPDTDSSLRDLFYMNRTLLLMFLPRIRVEDEAGLGLMEACPVCSRNSAIGTQVSLIPTCNHACHPRCLFDWLSNGNSLCPLCSGPIPTDDNIEDFLQF